MLESGNDEVVVDESEDLSGDTDEAQGHKSLQRSTVVYNNSATVELQDATVEQQEPLIPQTGELPDHDSL